jgi:AAHS family 4-hydroxybenzoate transporter-like MFS transporter
MSAAAAVREQVRGTAGLYPWLVVGLCALVALCDGFDTQAIAFVVPVMAKVWGKPVAGFGPVFALGLFAGTIGSVVSGLVADRHGRRVTIIATTALFAAGSLLTVLSRGMDDLMVYRSVAGFGLGGVIPSIVVLSAEFAPARLRATVVSAMLCGIPLGALLGAAVSAPLIQAWGWRAVFAAGGAAPLPLLPLLGSCLPGSIGWLKTSEGAGQIRPRAQLPSIDESAPPKASLSALLTRGRGPSTLALWATFFLSLMLAFFLVSWIPAVAVAQTHQASSGAAASALLNVGGILGALVLGQLVDWLGSFEVVGSAFALASIGIMAAGLGREAHASIFIFSLVGGFFGMGAQLCVVAVAADFYPRPLRATGVGAAMGAGRFGAMAGSLSGGAILSLFGGMGQFPPILGGLALAACLAVVSAGLLKPRRPGLETAGSGPPGPVMMKQSPEKRPGRDGDGRDPWPKQTPGRSL